MRKLYYWKLEHREIQLGERTILMGVLNVTPDSFSDGGKYSEPDRAFARALELEEQGADIVDIGGESTKPGSSRISVAEEMRRLIPVLKRLKGRLNVPISVDTYKAEVAERGRPETWAKLGPMPDPMATIGRDLDAAISRARHVGVDKSKLVIDPGLGFGKRKEQSAMIIGRLAELAVLDQPVMMGPSRKSFLAHVDPEETKFATAAAVAACVLGGAHIVRVHDVREMRAASDVADEILRNSQ